MRHLHCEKPVRYGERHPEVNPVSWNVVLAQMVSVLFAGILHGVSHGERGTVPAFHDFYTDHLVIGAAIVIALVLWSCC